MIWSGLVGLSIMSRGCTSLDTDPTASFDALEKQTRQVLYNAVENENPLVRVHAIETLAQIPDLQTLPLIRKGLYDPVPAVRFAATVAIGDVQDYASRHLVEKLLRDENVSVQLAAGYALEKMGDRRFRNWFDKVLFSRDEKLSGMACMLLGRLGHTGIRRDSRDKLWQVFRMENQYPSVQLQAAEALARLNDPDILRKLLVFANSIYADDRLLAIEGLKHIGGSDVFAMLTVLADDPQIEVRLSAIRALADFADKDHRAVVRDHINYAAPNGKKQATIRVRSLALMALGRVGGPEDIKRFRKALNDPSPFIRVAAARGAIDLLKKHDAM